MTTIDSIKAQLQSTQKRVIELTGFSEEQINAMVFESAYEWLAYQGCDDHIQTQFASTKEFWGFWKLDIWHQGDLSFIAHCDRYQFDDQLTTRFYYECYHYVNGNIANSAEATAGYHSLIKKLALKL